MLRASGYERNATFITLRGAAVSTFNLSDEEENDSFALPLSDCNKVDLGCGAPLSFTVAEGGERFVPRELCNRGPLSRDGISPVSRSTKSSRGRCANNEQERQRTTFSLIRAVTGRLGASQAIFCWAHGGSKPASKQLAFWSFSKSREGSHPCLGCTGVFREGQNRTSYLSRKNSCTS